MIKIGVILGSTRPGRNGAAVAKWVMEHAASRAHAEYELIDLMDHPLPHFDEPLPPSLGRYAKEHTKKWAETIARFDGFVFVTPEYNHSTSGALKNAIDYLYGEWNNKAAGIVSYGGAGGARAAEHLRLILGELMVADVRAQVTLNLLTDFENRRLFKPAEGHLTALGAMLDQLEAWSAALSGLRLNSAAGTARQPPADLESRGPKGAVIGRQPKR
ncbi:NADPH-dependent FMN reductase [Streptomyces mirabilis]|uniref:NADPH-dependent FMN reductase n=1 Tax=Streptomyces mirabilis TaxID=68239 RepID=UPI0036AA672A